MRQLILFCLVVMTAPVLAANHIDECEISSSILKEIPLLAMPTLQRMKTDKADDFQKWNINTLVPMYNDAMGRVQQLELPKEKFKYMLITKSFTALKNSPALADDVYYYLKDKTEKNKKRIKIKTDFIKRTLNDFETQCPEKFKSGW